MGSNRRKYPQKVIFWWNEFPDQATNHLLVREAKNARLLVISVLVQGQFGELLYRQWKDIMSKFAFYGIEFIVIGRSSGAVVKEARLCTLAIKRMPGLKWLKIHPLRRNGLVLWRNLACQN